jgi:toxin ParE1/3/4
VLRDGVRRIARLIGEHPDIGVVKADLAPDRYRFLTIRGFDYLVVYRAVGLPRPRILRILHGARDLAALLANIDDAQQ